MKKYMKEYREGLLGLLREPEDLKVLIKSMGENTLASLIYDVILAPLGW